MSAQDKLDRSAEKHGLGSDKRIRRIKKAKDFFSKPVPTYSKDELRKMGHPVESSAEYGKSMDRIRDKEKNSAIKPKDRDTLGKLADLMKKQKRNEAYRKPTQAEIDADKKKDGKGKDSSTRYRDMKKKVYGNAMGGLKDAAGQEYTAVPTKTGGVSQADRLTIAKMDAIMKKRSKDKRQKESVNLEENKIFFVKVGTGRDHMTVKVKAPNSREALKKMRAQHPKDKVALDQNQKQGRSAGALESVETNEASKVPAGMKFDESNLRKMDHDTFMAYGDSNPRGRADPAWNAERKRRYRNYQAKNYRRMKKEDLAEGLLQDLGNVYSAMKRKLMPNAKSSRSQFDQMQIDALKNMMDNNEVFKDIVNNGITKSGSWKPGYKQKFDNFMKRNFKTRDATKLGLNPSGASSAFQQKIKQRHAMMNPKESVEDVDEATMADRTVLRAVRIAKDMAGNHTGASKRIEKMKKGLSDHPKVKDALRSANESVATADKKPQNFRDPETGKLKVRMVPVDRDVVRGNDAAKSVARKKRFKDMRKEQMATGNSQVGKSGRDAFMNAFKDIQKTAAEIQKKKDADKK